MFRALIVALRPRQWVKNLFVAAPAVFAQVVFFPGVLARVGLAVLLFSAASSAVYLLNDIVDVEADRKHPRKRNRPIASGALPLSVAWLSFGGLVLLSLGAGFVLGATYTCAVFAYLLLNVAYSFRLKHIAYVDVLCIAAGFELRVFAGSIAAGVPVSTYLLGIMFTLAMFLGFGKRYHELRQEDRSSVQRRSLLSYNTVVVRAMMVAMMVGTVGIYVVYTLDADTVAMFGTPHLVWTSVIAALGVGRFVWITLSRDDAESPTDQMLRDPLFLLNIFAWVVAVVFVIYGPFH